MRLSFVTAGALAALVLDDVMLMGSANTTACVVSQRLAREVQPLDGVPSQATHPLGKAQHGSMVACR